MYLFIRDRTTVLSQRLSRNFYSKHLPTAGPSVSSDQDAQGYVHSGVAIAQGVPLSSAGERFFLCPTFTFYFTSGTLASPCAAQPLAAFSQPPAHRCRFLPQPKPALFFHLPAWEEPFPPQCFRGPSWVCSSLSTSFPQRSQLKAAPTHDLRSAELKWNPCNLVSLLLL